MATTYITTNQTIPPLWKATQVGLPFTGISECVTQAVGGALQKLAMILSAILGAFELHECSSQLEAINLAKVFVDRGLAVTLWQNGEKWMVKA
ncbi:hypothetical protein CEK28_08890 [Xenophilus sp. AP218F]|nr:hypothetical protein CEK28_08890 [Xenophilus sp. AP218F]